MNLATSGYPPMKRTKKMTKRFEIKFLFHGTVHYIIDDTSGNAKDALKAIKRDFDRAKIEYVKQIAAKD